VVRIVLNVWTVCNKFLAAPYTDLRLAMHMSDEARTRAVFDGAMSSLTRVEGFTAVGAGSSATVIAECGMA
jgi:hypothetical protein